MKEKIEERKDENKKKWKKESNKREKKENVPVKRLTYILYMCMYMLECIRRE